MPLPPPPPDQRVVFSHSIEGLVRAYGRTVPEAARKALFAAGVDLGKPLKAAYPLDTYLKALEITARTLFPSLPESEQYFRLGRAWLEGYFTTLMGKAVIAMMRVLGPRRVMDKATSNFRTGNNYTTVDVKELGTNRWEIAIYPVVHPTLYVGVVQTGLELAGAKNLSVKELAFSEGKITMEASWA